MIGTSPDQLRVLAAVPLPRGASPRGHASLGPGTIQSRAARSEAGFPDAERLVKPLVAHELTLSVVPAPDQRLWRTLTRRKYQLTCNRVQLQNRLECLLEEAHLKLSSVVSDLLGPSARRMLQAIAGGKPIPRLWRRSRVKGCARRPSSYAMGLGRAPTCIRSIGGLSRWPSTNWA